MSEYIILKLVTGEMVFGDKTKAFSDGGIQLHDPRVIVARDDGVFMLIPYCFYSDDEQIIFNADAIIMVAKSSEDLIKTYTDWTKKEAEFAADEEATRFKTVEGSKKVH